MCFLPLVSICPQSVLYVQVVTLLIIVFSLVVWRKICGVGQDLYCSWTFLFRVVSIVCSHFSGTATQHQCRASCYRFFPIFVCWCIWKVRNQIVYDGTVSSFSYAVSILKNLLHSVTSWKPLKVRSSQLSTFSQLDFLNFLPLRRKTLSICWYRPQIN